MAGGNEWDCLWSSSSAWTQVKKREADHRWAQAVNPGNDLQVLVKSGSSAFREGVGDVLGQVMTRRRGSSGSPQEADLLPVETSFCKIFHLECSRWRSTATAAEQTEQIAGW